MRDRHDPVPRPGVVLPEVPRQRVKVRELPGVEEARQKPGPRGEATGGGRPAHQRGHAAHYPERGELGSLCVLGSGETYLAQRYLRKSNAIANKIGIHNFTTEIQSLKKIYPRQPCAKIEPHKYTANGVSIKTNDSIFLNNFSKLQRSRQQPTAISF